MRGRFRIHPALGLLGFLGVVGIFADPFYCIFFGFFGFFWWGMLYKEKLDERLVENLKKAERITGRLAIILCYLILLALSNGLAQKAIILWGCIGYAGIFILSPAIAYIMDKRE